MVTVTINPDKSWTVIFSPKAQAILGRIIAVRGTDFLQSWINAKFSEITKRVEKIEAEGIEDKFMKLDYAKKKQVRDILEGRV